MAAEEKKTVLNDKIKTLADKIYAGIACDKETGVIAASEGKDHFADNLPENVTMEIINNVDSYRRDFVVASTHAAGMASIDAMASNKKLESTSASFSLGGKDKVDMSFQRSEVVNNPMVPNSSKTHYCNPSVKVTSLVGKKGSQLGNAIKLVREAALAKLG